MALPPRRFAYKLLVRAKLSQPKVHLRKWGRKNNTIVEINNEYFNLQTSKGFKQQMFIT
jgi:hypothetical protein